MAMLPTQRDKHRFSVYAPVTPDKFLERKKHSVCINLGDPKLHEIAQLHRAGIPEVDSNIAGHVRRGKDISGHRVRIKKPGTCKLKRKETILQKYTRLMGEKPYEHEFIRNTSSKKRVNF